MKVKEMEDGFIAFGMDYGGKMYWQLKNSTNIKDYVWVSLIKIILSTPI